MTRVCVCVCVCVFVCLCVCVGVCVCVCVCVFFFVPTSTLVTLNRYIHHDKYISLLANLRVLSNHSVESANIWPDHT